MSTNKTENYQLHSWAPSDDFLRAEINENFQKLDAAVGGLQSWTATACVVGAVAAPRHTDLVLDFGFRPKALFLIEQNYYVMGLAMEGGGVRARYLREYSSTDIDKMNEVQFTDTGVRVPAHSGINNDDNRIYLYLALR